MSLIFLVGFMGCGKTSWGRKLSAALGYEFIDLDHEFEAYAGMTIPEYFTTHGEDVFRRLESDILKTTPYKANTVVSTGGGLPVFFDNMDWMNKHGKTLYIELSPRALAGRLENAKTQRPVLQGKKGDDLVELITEKLAEREQHYIKASYHISGIDMNVEKLAQKLDLPLV